MSKNLLRNLTIKYLHRMKIINLVKIRVLKKIYLKIIINPMKVLRKFILMEELHAVIVLKD